MTREYFVNTNGQVMARCTGFWLDGKGKRHAVKHVERVR